MRRGFGLTRIFPYKLLVKISGLPPDKKKEMVEVCGSISTVVANAFTDMMIWV
jgi:hypothetical protein